MSEKRLNKIAKKLYKEGNLDKTSFDKILDQHLGIGYNDAEAVWDKARLYEVEKIEGGSGKITKKTKIAGIKKMNKSWFRKDMPKGLKKKGK